MGAQEFKKLLEKSNDKFSLFSDSDLFSKYRFEVFELIEILKEFLSDEEKAKLFELNHFRQLSSSIKIQIIKCILNDNIKLNLLRDTEFMAEFEKSEVIYIIFTLNDKNKLQILSNVELLKQGLGLKDYEIIEMIKTLESEEVKLQLIEIYNLPKYEIGFIICTFSDKSKIKIMLENPYEFNKFDFLIILRTLSVNSLLDFFNNNKNFFEENQIKLYEVTRALKKEQQLQLIQYIDEFAINLDEKRKILATMHKEAKQEIDTSKLPKEYETAIKIEICEELGKDIPLYKAVVDFLQDLEVYRGLDEIIFMNPMQVPEQYKTKISELCTICPQVKIYDDLGLGFSTVEEYRESETWIESVLQGMNPNWTDIQKIAFIDNAIGKKISYIPDFDTEVCDEDSARALWKVISTGYGVCNGIAQIERYMLSKIGIEAEEISSRIHAFLRLKNIEIPNKNGDTQKGDTILDPTWNLAAHRYGCIPNDFCRSYEEIRKHDIRSDGKDSECHKKDERLSDVILDLDEESLRSVFGSIGLTDKDGNFHAKELVKRSESIDELEISQEEKIQKQFELLAEYCPEFAICQNSTSSILEAIILDQPSFNFNRCVINRVYEREDKDKRPVLYVYIDSPEMGKKFYYADKEQGKFFELSQKEFEEKFECYEQDMKSNNGHRHWEDEKDIEEVEDLSRSSGKVVSGEGEDR